jgi:hypothetical protein
MYLLQRRNIDPTLVIKLLASWNYEIIVTLCMDKLNFAPLLSLAANPTYGFYIGLKSSKLDLFWLKSFDMRTSSY